MIFSTSLFLLYFLPAFIAVYTLTPHRFKNLWALIASIFFYVWGAPNFFFILAGSIVADFLITSNFKNVKKPQLLIGTSLVLNIGLLLYFKYVNFFVENISTLLIYFGAEGIHWHKIALPIGISFFTFQKISYAIDVYRGRSNALSSIRDYALYIMLFPQLIAGPIVRYNEVADQLTNRRANETYQDKLIGFYRFVIGLSKKVLIANSIGEFADGVFNAPVTDYNWLTNWLGAIAYTLQIYFDFSGYSDMAIGLGRLMGFRFPENFNNPLISRSITEFWRRWHITLSSWMRDYIYIPIGGSKVGKYRVYINLWIVFLVSGIWHGANWTFVIWGCIHGAFISLEKLFLNKHLNNSKYLSRIYTFLVVVMAFLIFRSESLTQAIHFYKSMFDFSVPLQFPEITNRQFFFIIFAIILSYITLFGRGKVMHDFLFFKNSYTKNQHVIISLLMLILFYLCVGYINSQDFNPFIYFRF